MSGQGQRALLHKFVCAHTYMSVLLLGTSFPLKYIWKVDVNYGWEGTLLHLSLG
ncbi:hypothetical protein I79_018619 [Cricetulus griseus]|uniref:Uncharacterized protein n=1 Tax=Cricetulus griseus TaxID=10029 RepID=G3I575_CRIGR|nr:hypothetical protein I79_018619 [Cricetulus griseus]